MITFISEPTWAEDAYSWKDKYGTLFYGDNPPENAIDVHPLKTKPLSRYSSDKLLDSYGKTKEEVIPAPTTNKKSKLDEIVDAVTGLVIDKKDLEQLDLAVEHNAQGQITKCEVSIKNNSSVNAGGVVVSFEFEDGSILPGSGPDTIMSNETAVFGIVPEMFPLKIKTKSAKPANPKVLIDLGNS